MAQSGNKVLIVDADLRRPSQHKVHGFARSPGLTHFLTDQLPLHMAVRPTAVANLDLLAAGAEVSNPAELLASPKMVGLIEEVRQRYDIVIVDTSPLLVVTDPLLTAAAVDGIVLVIRAAVTRRHDAERCQDLLNTLQTPVLGLVINGIDLGQLGYGYGYLYGYGAYGRGKPVGDGDDPVSSHPLDRAASTAEVARIGQSGTNGHPTVDS